MYSHTWFIFTKYLLFDDPSFHFSERVWQRVNFYILCFLCWTWKKLKKILVYYSSMTAYLKEPLKIRCKHFFAYKRILTISLCIYRHRKHKFARMAVGFVLWYISKEMHHTSTCLNMLSAAIFILVWKLCIVCMRKNTFRRQLRDHPTILLPKWCTVSCLLL